MSGVTLAAPKAKHAVAVRRDIVLPALIFAIFALLPAVAALTSRQYLIDVGARMMVFAVAAVALDLLVGYAGLMLLRSRRIHRARRLCGRYLVGARHRRGPHRLAGSHSGFDAVCLAHRHRLSAHARRLFHHDHACLWTDGLFHRHVARSLWRRQRADHRRAQHYCGLAAHQKRPRLLLLHPALPARDLFVLPRAGRLALRPRAARRQGERRPHGHDRLQCAAFSARRLYHCRRAWRLFRLPAREI